MMLASRMLFGEVMSVSLFEFLHNHSPMVAGWVIALLALLVVEWRIRSRSPQRVHSQQLVSLMNREQALVVDIRSAEAFRAGHILGSHHVEQGQLADWLRQQAEPSDPVVLVCNKGLTAPEIGSRLVAEGFQQIYYLSGGMSEWVQENLPVQTSSS